MDNSQKHLTHDERRIIAVGIQNGSTHTAIARTLGKSKSTIGKEIKLHRIFKRSNSLPLDCANYKGCRYGRICTKDCPSYSPFICKRRDRSPGACNGCSKYSTCRFNKYIYDADDANHNYEYVKKDSRIGVNLTSKEAENIANIIKPLLQKGQSVYHIATSQKDLNLCEKTLYNYIETGVFQTWNIGPLDLRRQVSRKLPKQKAVEYKKRVEKQYIIGRTYKDYLAFKNENLNVNIVQMDTVYNDGSNGPFIQTFKFLSYGFLFAIYQEEKTALSMLNGILYLEHILGKDLFKREVQVLLTDRGPEFTSAIEVEKDNDGCMRTRVFFCDPMQSCQKGSIENNHEELRYICPKETNLYNLGLVNQDALSLAISHINSMKKEALKNRTPFELMEFFAPDLLQRFQMFGIHEIPASEVILKPYLLKHFKK